MKTNSRESELDVDALFLNRWSPRAMSGEALTKPELMTLFEAAKWAPSSSNEQPWRFVYAERTSERFKTFLGLLVEANQRWAKDSAALIVMISRNTFEKNGKENATHSFDTGSAWVSLAFQASLKGLVAHGMAGFDYDRARYELNVPDGFTVEAMAAVGKPAAKEVLPPDLQEREKPSLRKPLEQIIFEGVFPK